MAERVALHPVGMPWLPLLEEVRVAVAAAFATEATLGVETALPPATLNPERGQYTAAEIIYALAQEQREGERVLGVLAVDLYSPGLNFVFGQAAPGIGVAVISLFRLRPEFYSLPSDEALLTERAVKEALHEMGHLFGLGHCRRSFCVMFFSNCLRHTDRKGVAFCSTCITRLYRKRG